jgi:hypothetical protein
MPIQPTVRTAVTAGHARTTDGRLLGAIRHVDGRREIVLPDPVNVGGAAQVVALEDREAHRVADLPDATINPAHVTDLDRHPDGLTALDWHVLALAMFLAPVAVTSVAHAVSQGFVEALVAAVLAVGLLVGYLTRHQR